MVLVAAVLVFWGKEVVAQQATQELAEVAAQMVGREIPLLILGLLVVHTAGAGQVVVLLKQEQVQVYITLKPEVPVALVP
jgi:hypothetical protein